MYDRPPLAVSFMFSMLIVFFLPLPLEKSVSYDGIALKCVLKTGYNTQHIPTHTTLTSYGIPVLGQARDRTNKKYFKTDMCLGVCVVNW